MPAPGNCHRRRRRPASSLPIRINANVSGELEIHENESHFPEIGMNG